LDKMCVNSCLVTTAYVFLLLAVLACALSYVAPFWVLFPKLRLSLSAVAGVAGSVEVNSLYKIGTWDIGIAGLWGACDDDYETCGWFWEDDFHAEKNLPGGCYKIQDEFI